MTKRFETWEEAHAATDAMLAGLAPEEREELDRRVQREISEWNTLTPIGFFERKVADNPHEFWGMIEAVASRPAVQNVLRWIVSSSDEDLLFLENYVECQALRGGSDFTEAELNSLGGIAWFRLCKSHPYGEQVEALLAAWRKQRREQEEADYRHSILQAILEGDRTWPPLNVRMGEEVASDA